MDSLSLSLSLSLSPSSLFFRLEKLKPSYLDELGIGPTLLVPNDQQMGSRPVGYNIHPHLDSYTSPIVAMVSQGFEVSCPKHVRSKGGGEEEWVHHTSLGEKPVK